MDTRLSTFNQFIVSEHDRIHTESSMYPLPGVILLNILKKFSLGTTEPVIIPASRHLKLAWDPGR
jgi:hypothetical protein